MTKDMKQTLSFADLYEDHRSFQQKDQIRQQKDQIRSALADIAVGYNLCGEKSIELADKIMLAVQRYETCYTMVQEDTTHAMRSFFRSLDAYPPQKRIAILNELVFTLEAFSDETLLEQMEEKDFSRILPQDNEDIVYDESLENEMNLKDRLMEQVEKMNLSPLAMKAMVRKLKHSPTAYNAYVLGKESFQLKCAAAMHLYLENKPYLSPSEAVSHACSDIYMQTAANAVAMGILTEKAAAAILLAVIVTAMLFLAVYLETFAPLPLAILGSIGLGITAYEYLSPLTQRAGKLGTKMYQTLLGAKETALQGLEQIADFIWNQCTEKVRHQVELDMLEEAMLAENEQEEECYIF